MINPFAPPVLFTTAAKVAALVLGTFIVYLAYKGFRRNRSRPLLYVALGFALITAGTIAEGIIYIMSSELLTAIATGTTITVLGFLAIIYSIYAVKD
jgi:hypothetical protein